MSEYILAVKAIDPAHDHLPSAQQFQHGVVRQIRTRIDTTKPRMNSVHFTFEPFGDRDVYELPILDPIFSHPDLHPIEPTSDRPKDHDTSGLPLQFFSQASLSSLRLVLAADDDVSGLDNFETMVGRTRDNDDVYRHFTWHDLENGRCENGHALESCFCSIYSDVGCFPLEHVLNFRTESANLRSNIHLQHGETLYFHINATNYAGWTSAKEVELRLDFTPPATGHVIDAALGGADIAGMDISEPTMIASVSGFVDHESGIDHYSWFVGTACVSKESYEGSAAIRSTFRDSVEPYITWTVKDPEVTTYFTSVIAWNGALSRSDMRCTNGVKMDGTPPVVENIRVANMVVRPGLIRQIGSSHINFLNKHGHLFPLPPWSGSCALRALQVDERAFLRVVPQKMETIDSTIEAIAFTQLSATPLKSRVVMNVTECAQLCDRTVSCAAFASSDIASSKICQLHTAESLNSRHIHGNGWTLYVFADGRSPLSTDYAIAMKQFLNSNCNGHQHEARLLLDGSADSLNITWEAFDDESGVKQFEVAVGTSATDDDIMHFTSTKLTMIFQEARHAALDVRTCTIIAHHTDSASCETVR